MALTLQAKQVVVEEVAGEARSAHSVVAAEYRGLSVADMTELRVKAKQQDVHLRVVRNTLARRALKGTDFECMTEQLVGPLVLAFSRSEPGSAARLVRDFAKTNEKLVPKVVGLGGQALPGSQLAAVADLPSMDEARSMLLSVLMAPASKLVRTLNEPGALAVRVLNARREQQESEPAS